MSRARPFAFAMLASAALGACTPENIAYCRGFPGIEGTGEFDRCLDYYARETAAFQADYAVCSAQADQTYPQGLYDRGRLEPSGFATYGGVGGFSGIGGYGRWGGWGGPQWVPVPPDAAHNALVDELRQKIITPCMQSRGWNSGSDWQAGHRPRSSRPTPSAPSSSALPWLKSK